MPHSAEKNIEETHPILPLTSGLWQEIQRSWNIRSNIRVLYRRFTKLLPLLFHFHTHQEIVRSLEAINLGILRLHPQAPLKYLKNYLALSFSRTARSAILLNHYRYLKKIVEDDFLERITANPPILWCEEKESVKYDIVLIFPRQNDNEGDLMLKFRRNDIPIYTFAFSIVPGSFVSSPLKNVLFIGQMQGAPNSFTLIREATKALFENSPQAILIAAIQGIALALNLQGLCSVSAKNQATLAINKSLLPSFQKTYDEFFHDNNAHHPNPLFFHLPVPLEEKPITSIKRNHRPRVLRKRNFKHQVKDCVMEIFQSELLKKRRL